MAPPCVPPFVGTPPVKKFFYNPVAEPPKRGVKTSLSDLNPLKGEKIKRFIKKRKRFLTQAPRGEKIPQVSRVKPLRIRVSHKGPIQIKNLLP